MKLPEYGYLAANGEEAAAVGVHEHLLASIASVGAVGVYSEDKAATAVVDGESVAGKEERGLADSQVRLLCVDEVTVHYYASLHGFNFFLNLCVRVVDSFNY